MITFPPDSAVVAVAVAVALPVAVAPAVDGATQLKAWPTEDTPAAVAACLVAVAAAGGPVAVAVAAMRGTGRRTFVFGLGHLTGRGGIKVWATLDSCLR